MTESLSTYAVEAGTVLVYIATKKGNETGRRYFLTEMEPGEQIPSMLHEEMGEQWVLVFSAMGEAVVAEIPGIDESVIRTFAKKISLVLLDVERFGEEMVEMVNMKLITEEGFVYAVSEEQEKTREKGLTLIYNMFHKKTRSSQADKSGNALYDTLAFICGQKRMKIASYDSMKEACGRRFGVDDIARVSHFAARRVLLEEEWFRNDSGILLVFRADKKVPCAAVPKGAGRYELHDCVKGTSVRLTEKTARTLSPEAYMIYRPFPNQALSVMDLVKFSIPAVKKSDLANLFLMAAVSALIGLLLPFMNQKIFDEYIPMGDRATLLQISVLILSFTVGNLLFTMIKNIAVFRFTNACEYGVQAAVFDRLYNLPGSGLYIPWSGEIYMDNMPVRDIPKEILSSSVSTVSQSITLFSGTIRDNLTMWNKSILEEDMIQAAKDACIHDIITNKPGAYEYVLTEGGHNLSGGQRQRLEIARALVTNPTVLIMDEATSALDPLVEKEIMDNIKRRGCTCVIVAHRLSAIRDCDEIIVMEHGKIVQRGSHDELMSQPGHYQALVQTI